MNFVPTPCTGLARHAIRERVRNRCVYKRFLRSKAFGGSTLSVHFRTMFLRFGSSPLEFERGEPNEADHANHL